MPKKLAKEKTYIIIGVVALLLVLVFAVSVVLMQKTDEKSDTTRSLDTAQAKEEAEQKRLGKQVEDARAAELLRLSSDEPSKEKKVEYLVELALIHFNRNDFKEALRIGLDAESQAQSAQSAALLGDIYFATKDYSQAAKQYGVAMDRSDKTPSGQKPYNEYAILKQKAEDAQ